MSQQCLRKRYFENGYTEYVCSICGMLPVWQGKPLTLILDHINGINNDNRIENLRWVCPNCNQQLPTTGFKKMRGSGTQKSFCIDCGKEIYPGSTRCKSCARKYVKRNGSNCPDRDILKQDIRNNTFADVGRKYGVEDTTIKRWCKKMNLPSMKHDIDNYSDEEWAKI